MQLLRTPEATCGSDAARNDDAALCERSYEWSATTNLASPCEFHSTQSVTEHVCESGLCRDINDDCCTIPGEVAKCDTSGGDYRIEERGSGSMSILGNRECPTAA